MTNAITNHGTVQTRVNAIGAELRSETVARRDQRSSYVRKHLGKRLHPAHRCAPADAVLPAFSAAAQAMPGAMPVDRWSGSVCGWVLPTAADLDLPAAAWATLVIAKAISA